MSVHSFPTQHTPEQLAQQLQGEPGLVLLRSGLRDPRYGRYSLLTARPFLVLRCWGATCELLSEGRRQVQFGNPWQILEGLMARYELSHDIDLPFPLGGCFGYWGYGLKDFVEPGLSRQSVRDLEIPDGQLGFYGSVVIFDHELGRTWLVATGLKLDGSRDLHLARAELEFWKVQCQEAAEISLQVHTLERPRPRSESPVHSNLSQTQFVRRVREAQNYIRHGHIYQVNLAQRFSVARAPQSWELYQRLAEISPAPFAAYLDGGSFQIVSSSPELFLRLSGRHILTRPIKGTRPRSTDPTRDTQLTFELQSSPKELAELVMITDLLRNDLGRICEFGSVQVPELVRLERFAHVQHLVATVEGRLRPEVTHCAALAACFPGGSITGAPKVRAMQIIEELEPVARGPYTGALGYLGFNGESQLSILIRAAVCENGMAHFHAGAGIVADSIPEAEYEETLAKARGFFEAIHTRHFNSDPAPSPRPR